MKDPINVGLGERVISRDPEDVIVAFGLGSCLGIVMVDPVSRLCGMIHAVLPERLNGADPHSPKFVTNGINGLLAAMIEAGAEKRRLVIKMAGGANMLISSGLSNTFDIGTRNIEAARRTFAQLGLPLKAEDVGGNLGRTVRLYVASGKTTVRVINGKEKDL
jgi:chemotaxis protein CheD